MFRHNNDKKMEMTSLIHRIFYYFFFSTCEFYELKNMYIPNLCTESGPQTRVAVISAINTIFILLAVTTVSLLFLSRRNRYVKKIYFFASIGFSDVAVISGKQFANFNSQQLFRTILANKS